jgi:hypothetical protein
LKLLGEGWISYGGARIPDNREIVVTEAEASEFLRHRGSARRVEILGWIEDSSQDDRVVSEERGRHDRPQ